MSRRTSIASLQAVSGTLGGKRVEVAQAFRQYGPGTSAEVLRKAGLDANRNLARARVTELADLGVLREAGERACKVTGRKAIVWEVAPLGTKPRPKKRLVRLTDADIEVLREVADGTTHWFAVEFERVVDKITGAR